MKWSKQNLRFYTEYPPPLIYDLEKINPKNNSIIPKRKSPNFVWKSNDVVNETIIKTMPPKTAIPVPPII